MNILDTMDDYWSRRVIVYVSENNILDMIRGWHAAETRIVSSCFSHIPRDARVLSVCHDPMRRSFGFAIVHPSFDVVADGEMPPIVPDNLHLTYKTLNFLDKSDGMHLLSHIIVNPPKS